jgi:hypothetical protein
MIRTVRDTLSQNVVAFVRKMCTLFRQEMKTMLAVQDQILDRINSAGRGKVFISKLHFP